jgi:hypothetical protein
MTDYSAVLAHLYPDAQWSLNGDDYSGLTWLDDSPKPSQEELDGAWPAVQTARLNAQAAADRAAAYAVEADPLFFYWQAGEGSEGAWLAKRAEIRDRFPYAEVVG